MLTCCGGGGCLCEIQAPAPQALLPQQSKERGDGRPCFMGPPRERTQTAAQGAPFACLLVDDRAVENPPSILPSLLLGSRAPSSAWQVTTATSAAVGGRTRMAREAWCSILNLQQKDTQGHSPFLHKTQRLALLGSWKKARNKAWKGGHRQNGGFLKLGRKKTRKRTMINAHEVRETCFLLPKDF